MEEKNNLITSLHDIFILAQSNKIFGNIPRGEFFVMNIISKLDMIGEGSELGVKLSVMCDILKISLPAISKRMKTLETKGYIMRILDPKDRRISYVKLTDKGRETVIYVRKILSDRCEKTCEKLGEKETEQLIYLLKKMKICMEDVMREEEESRI